MNLMLTGVLKICRIIVGVAKDDGSAAFQGKAESPVFKVTICGNRAGFVCVIILRREKAACPYSAVIIGRKCAFIGIYGKETRRYIFLKLSISIIRLPLYRDRRSVYCPRLSCM